MKHRSEFFEIYAAFRALIKTQHSAVIKCFRCDLGGEYTNKFCQMLALDGTIHQTSCTDTPEQNGVAERKHRHIVETARSLLKLRAYSDADHDSDPINRKYVTEFCIFLGDSLIYRKSKKQSIVSQSSTEAKYRVMASTTKEIVWLCWLLADMGVFFSHPTPMYCDNQSSIQIAHNSVFHERTKHIEIDCHFTRHHLKHDTITLPFVPSSLQIADFFTKAHSISRVCFLVGKLLMLVAAAS